VPHPASAGLARRRWLPTVGAAAGLDATIALHLGHEQFPLRITGGELTLNRGNNDRSDATLDTNQTTLVSLLRTDHDIDEALASGSLRIAGDRALIEKFRHLFSLPGARWTGG
jgi:putative sterol carrier protein